ncbi:MAG: carbonic anhydrase [Xenococcaceae cyanobacterium]
MSRKLNYRSISVQRRSEQAAILILRFHDIKSRDDKVAIKKATKANVLYQINQLNQSPVISQLKAENKLKVVGSYFNFDTGEIMTLSI